MYHTDSVTYPILAHYIAKPLYEMYMMVLGVGMVLYKGMSFYSG
jgi:hypothetical protein